MARTASKARLHFSLVCLCFVLGFACGLLVRTFRGFSVFPVSSEEKEINEALKASEEKRLTIPRSSTDGGRQIVPVHKFMESEQGNSVILPPGQLEAVKAACLYKQTTNATTKESAVFAYTAVYGAISAEDEGSFENWMLANKADRLTGASQVNKFIDWISKQESEQKGSSSKRLIESIEKECP